MNVHRHVIEIVVMISVADRPTEDVRPWTIDDGDVPDHIIRVHLALIHGMYPFNL